LGPANIRPESKIKIIFIIIRIKTIERGWGQGGEMTQALYAHMNNKRKKKKRQLRFKTSPGK
jgi:hypothetical protein